GKLTEAELLERWDEVLACAREIVAGFDEETLRRRATLNRERPVRDLASHVFQIAESFAITLEEGIVVSTEFQDDPRAGSVTRADLLAYTDRTLARYGGWLRRRGAAAIPGRIATYYGEHPSHVVVERSVWHSTQHARQLDAIAAGLGFEYRIPPELYRGLPLP